MEINFRFKIDRPQTVIIIVAIAIVMSVLGGQITDILTDKNSIVAVHGTLIAGFIAIIAAQMTVKAMNKQIAHGRFMRDLDNYERVAAKTSAIAQEVEVFLCEIESKLKFFEFGQPHEGMWVVSSGVKDVKIEKPILINKPDFIIDLPRNDARSIHSMKSILETLLKDEPSGRKSGCGGRIYYDPQEVKAYVSFQKFHIGPCKEILRSMTCYRPAPKESNYH